MRTLDDIIASMPADRHAAVLARGRKLIAEEAARRRRARRKTA